MTCTAATRPRWLARQRWRRLRPQAGRGVVAAVESAEVVAGRSSWRRGSSLSMHVALLRMIHDSPPRPHTLNCFNRRPLQVEIPSLIVGRIIGKGGSTIKEITTRRARPVGLPQGDCLTSLLLALEQEQCQGVGRPQLHRGDVGALRFRAARGDGERAHAHKQRDCKVSEDHRRSSSCSLALVQLLGGGLQTRCPRSSACCHRRRPCLLSAVVDVAHHHATPPASWREAVSSSP